MKTIFLLFSLLFGLSACEKNSVNSKSIDFYIAIPKVKPEPYKVETQKIDFTNLKLIGNPLNLKDLIVYNRGDGIFTFKKSTIDWLSKNSDSPSEISQYPNRCIVIQIDNKIVFGAWIWPNFSSYSIDSPLMIFYSDDPNIIYLSKKKNFQTQDNLLFEELETSGFYERLQKDGKLK